MRGNIKVFMVILVLIVLGLGLYWWNKNKVPTSQTTPTTQVGQNQDLDSISADLDNTDVDGPIDQGLAQNDSDVSTF